MSSSQNFSWNSLDNAAKIFPCATDKRDTKVFRFVCELREAAEPLVLKEALLQTLEEFPLFRSVLRRGLFWYYLQQTDLEPVVAQENEPPCSQLYNGNSRGLLFRVTYFQKRINLEIYHALTDGTGAMVFFKTLVSHYLAARYGFEKDPACLPAVTDASEKQKTDDSFQHYYTGKGLHAGRKQPRAFRIRGLKTPVNRVRVISGAVSAKAVLELSHRHETTLTLFLAGVMACAIEKTMSAHDRRRPVVVAIPVNLRNYFPSQSLRNFFSVVNVSYSFGGAPASLQEVIDSFAAQLKDALTKENLEERLNRLMALEKNVVMRMVPLFLKDPVMHYFYHHADNTCTVSLSNLGKVDLPAPLRPYVRLFEVYVSTAKVQMCSCTFQDTLMLSFTSAFLQSDVQMEFFRMLEQMGVACEITANRIDEE